MVGCQIFASHVDYLVCIFPAWSDFCLYSVCSFDLNCDISFSSIPLAECNMMAVIAVLERRITASAIFSSSSLGCVAGWCAGGPHTCKWDSSLARLCSVDLFYFFNNGLECIWIEIFEAIVDIDPKLRSDGTSRS